MADSISVTPGLGKSVATESVAGIDTQIISLGPRVTSPLSEAAINCAGNGDNVIVALSLAKVIRVYKFFLMATGGAVNVKWRDGAGGTDFHPALSLLGNGASWMLPYETIAWFTGTAGLGLILNLSGVVQVSGRVYYTQT